MAITEEVKTQQSAGSDKVVEIYEPTEFQSAVISRVIMRFNTMKEQRDKPRRGFDGRTLTEYVNDMSDAYNGIVPEDVRASKQDWQSLIFDNKTRGKVKAIVALSVAQRPYISILGETEEFEEFADDMYRTLDYTHRIELGNYKLFLQALSCAVKGTLIVEETYEEIKKKKKEVSSINPETGKISFKEKNVIEGGCGHVKCRITPLLTFYPNENHAEVKEDCATLTFMSMDNFKRKFGKYPNADKVTAGVKLQSLGDMKYKSLTTEEDTLVEMLRYYNEYEDEFIILANGIWINPQGEDEDQVGPLPYNHKRLPFVKTVYEIMDEEEFFGKAMPDLMAGEQETINAVLRMMIDQEILSIHKPLILGRGAELESLQMFPGKTISTTEDASQIQQLDMRGANQSSFQLLEFLSKRADVNTSIDSTAQGVGSGRKTAREAIILDENAKRMAGSFTIMIAKLWYQRAELRIPNICQFYKTPIQYVPITDKYGDLVLDENDKSITEPEYRTIPVMEEGQKPFWIKTKLGMYKARYYLRIEEDVEIALSRSYRVEIAKALLDEAKVNPLLDADNATLAYLRALPMGERPDKFYIPPSEEATADQEAINNNATMEANATAQENLGGGGQPYNLTKNIV
jgi:hypothetical protein